MTDSTTLAAVRRALGTVDDPEYPGVSITDMGMIGTCTVTGAHAHVELVPTFTGCPALGFIESDVRAAVQTVSGIDTVSVELDSSTIWDTSRLSATARRMMAEEFTVAVAAPGRATPCPRCGEQTLVETSMFGPTRCRSISRCQSCQETVEVVRA